MNHRPHAVRRTARSLLIALAVTATAAAGAVPAGAATRPALTLEAARSTVTVYRYTDGGDTYMDGDLGVYAVADVKQAFEVRTTRKDYGSPLVSRLVRKGKDRTLPVPADLSGLKDFSRTTFRDSKGKIVSTSTAPFCPNVYEPVRRLPKAPATSPYPQGCDGNPYSLGAVWGLQAGYAVSLSGDGGYYGSSELPDLLPGQYLAATSITPAYRKALRIPDAQAKTEVRVTVVEGDDDECLVPAGCRKAARARSTAARAAASVEKAPKKLSGAKAKPSGPLPDLRPLPAWGIVADGHYLNFSATVWNAGPGRLVVDGFRDSKDADLMNAYQYFFTASGKQKGYAPVGGMEWDARGHHQHWHFQDFARYRLVAADKKTPVVDSGKEAFCLANTDAVDYTVKGAIWKPQNTDLSTACGSREALGVREVLDTGSGDTYEQFREGQAFDLTTVKNGTYYIEVAANPDTVLYERSTKNNVSLRKVEIGGAKDKRTVKVEQVGVIVEPPVDLGDEGDERHG